MVNSEGEVPASPQPKFKMALENAMQRKHKALIVEDNSFLNADLPLFLK